MNSIAFLKGVRDNSTNSVAVSISVTVAVQFKVSVLN